MSERREVVQYSPVYLLTITPPAVPMTAVVVGHAFGGDGDEFWAGEYPVLGVQATVSGCYRRYKRGEYDTGTPTAPPSAASLDRQGYFTGSFHREHVEYDYLIHNDEYNAPETLSDRLRSVNVVGAVVPTASLPLSPGRLAELRAEAKDKNAATCPPVRTVPTAG